EVRERTVQTLGNRFTFITKTLEKQPFLTGDAFTIADAYLWALLNWADFHKVDLSPWPAIGAFRARVAQRPAVQATLKAEGLAK
ncbi:MAG: glutathione binding-like protein, partial [Gammaproteobacteria bacterium]|nr:glutathione binding-like protein [Gammaproteobacteria bacterium]